jgi:hypothetical protein
MHNTYYTKSHIALIQHMKLHKEHNTYCTKADILLLQDTNFRINKHHPLHSMSQFHQKDQKLRNHFPEKHKVLTFNL